MFACARSRRLALEAGADEAVLSLTRAGWAAGGGRANQAVDVEIRDLAEKIRTLYGRTKRKPPQPIEKTRAAQAAPRQVANYLYWLTP